MPNIVKVSCPTGTSQPPHLDNANTTPELGKTGAIECNTALELSDFFLFAVGQNTIYYASRKGTPQYTSPLFKLVHCLKSHPSLKHCTAEDAFTQLNCEVKPNWGQLFPDVPLPSLEFITAWEQINTPAGMSLWQTIEERVKNQALTLLAAPACEGYEHYLGVAFHLQRLTPTKDILLPVARLSGLLTTLLGKQVSEQSVSYYCRQARSNGYLKLIAKAHHPSGKAARYRFNLTRFTDTAVELEPDGKNVHSASSGFSHGSHSSHGSEGSEGRSGIEESSSSCVLAHACTHELIDTDNIQGKTINEHLGDNGERAVIEEMLPHTPVQHVKTSKKKSKIKRQSVVALWQSVMFSQSGWQEKLSDEDYKMLVKFGQRTDEFGCLILNWALNNWHEFAGTAVGAGTECPSSPSIAFFCAYQAVAFNLWLCSDASPEENAAIEKACETSNKALDDLVLLYTLGEQALFENVSAQLKYMGLLVKVPKGWKVCGQVFQYMTDIADKYHEDEEFGKLLREAATGTTK